MSLKKKNKPKGDFIELQKNLRFSRIDHNL